VQASEPDVLGLIRRHAETTPDHPAANDLNRSLTYAQLDAELRAVAGFLAAHGVEEGDRVALFLSNSVDFLVAALACSWLGATFVPLALGDPGSRLSLILESCEPAAVVVSGVRSGGEAASATRLPAGTYPQLTMVAARLGDADPPAARPSGDRPAYCIYTSGTTGTPKGVVTGQRAFAAAVNVVVEHMGLHPGSRALCVSPVHFVGSYAAVFPVLAAGGLLVIPPRESLALPRMFFRILASEEITHTGFSPTYLRLLLTSPEVGQLAASSLATLMFGGEALTMADLRSLWEAAPRLRVFNRYGQTETTGVVAIWPLDREKLQDATSVPIGLPVPGVNFSLVGDDGRLVVAAGEIGELYVGGRQLMKGYWRDPGLTDAVLRTDVVLGKTLFRTGDLCYRDEEGVYFFAGRADRMVKRSGIRISLLEVTEALADLPSVSAAVCVPYEGHGQLGIAAFVTTTRASSDRELRHALEALLPATMLPDRVEIVDRLPMTSGGKVDERVLLKAAGLRLASGADG